MSDALPDDTPDEPPAPSLDGAEEDGAHKNQVAAAIVRLTAERGPAKSICPTEAAKAVSAHKWRALLPEVRAMAVRLAKEGVIEITRKGQPVDPDDFKGVYRLRQAGPCQADP